MSQSSAREDRILLGRVPNSSRTAFDQKAARANSDEWVNPQVVIMAGLLAAQTEMSLHNAVEQAVTTTQAAYSHGLEGAVGFMTEVFNNAEGFVDKVYGRVESAKEMAVMVGDIMQMAGFQGDADNAAQVAMGLMVVVGIAKKCNLLGALSGDPDAKIMDVITDSKLVASCKERLPVFGAFLEAVGKTKDAAAPAITFIRSAAATVKM